MMFTNLTFSQQNNVVYRKGNLTLEVVTKCALVTMTFCFSSWSSMGAKFGAPLNLDSL